MKEEEITKIDEIRRKVVESIGLLILYIVVYIVVEALINNLLFPYLESQRLSIIPGQTPSISGYEPYVNVLISLLFGFFIVQGFANVVYWNLRLKYDHPTSASMRSVFRLIGIGALVAGIVGGIAGGVAGVALGGFLGIVIGFATQQVLGQAVDGLFLLLSRPFRIKDHVNMTGDQGIVEEVTTPFTYVIKQDGTKVVIPNNMVIGNKVYVYPRQIEQKQQTP